MVRRHHTDQNVTHQDAWQQLMELDVWNGIGCYDSVRDIPEDIDPNSSLLLETVGPIQ